jgi:hypothetical protein
MNRKNLTSAYTMEKCGRGYEVFRNGIAIGYFRTKRLAKKYMKSGNDHDK